MYIYTHGLLGVFVYSECKSPIKYMICKYFFPFLVFFFHFPYSIMCSAKLILRKFNLSIFFFCHFFILGVESKNPLSNTRS